MKVTTHPMYGAWRGMIGRCHNKNHYSYPGYGGRGIVVCLSWRKFENFLKDMGERPAGHSLDRIDPNGPYAPWNCRWATPAQQRANYSASGIERQRRGASDGAKRRWANTPRPPKPPKGKYQKLTPEQVAEIRRIGRSMTLVALGQKFGVAHATISLILRGKTHSPDYQKDAAEALSRK